MDHVAVSYDATNLLTSQTEPIHGSGSMTSTFGYDLRGAQTRFTNGRNNSFHTTYNSWGLPESAIEPATQAFPNLADRTFTTSYDLGGRAVKQTLPGGVITEATYDDMGRVLTQTGSGAEAATATRTFGYDLAGRPTSMSGSGGSNTMSYDDRGLLVSTTVGSEESFFAYNGVGQLTSRIDAAGTTTFGYDTSGRLSTAQNTARGVQLAYGYNAISQPATITYGNAGDQRWYTYDALHRLTGDELKRPNGDPVAKIMYGWDANGNLTSKNTTGFAGASDNTYEYDRANRLTSWKVGAANPTVYAYDNASNRTQAGTKTFTYDERNQLLSSPSSSQTYQYTARGTLRQTITGSVSVGTENDAFGQTIKQYSSATAFEEYSYDGLGRVIKSGFAYSGAGNTLASDGTHEYTRGANGELLGISQGSTNKLAWTDLHTDVVGQFDPTSTALTGSTTYDPLGKVVTSTGAIGNLGYQSEFTENSTGRVNMLARWYNTDTGQFDSRDSQTNSASPSSANANRHAYANANPMTGTDPSGHVMLALDTPVYQPPPGWVDTRKQDPNAQNDADNGPSADDILRQAMSAGGSIAGINDAWLIDGATLATECVKDVTECAIASAAAQLEAIESAIEKAKQVTLKDVMGIILDVGLGFLKGPGP